MGVVIHGVVTHDELRMVRAAAAERLHHIWANVECLKREKPCNCKQRNPRLSDSDQRNSLCEAFSPKRCASAVILNWFMIHFRNDVWNLHSKTAQCTDICVANYIHQQPATSYQTDTVNTLTYYPLWALNLFRSRSMGPFPSVMNEFSPEEFLKTRRSFWITRTRIRKSLEQQKQTTNKNRSCLG